MTLSVKINDIRRKCGDAIEVIEVSLVIEYKFNTEGIETKENEEV